MIYIQGLALYITRDGKSAAVGEEAGLSTSLQRHAGGLVLVRPDDDLLLLDELVNNATESRTVNSRVSDRSDGAAPRPPHHHNSQQHHASSNIHPSSTQSRA